MSEIACRAHDATLSLIGVLNGGRRRLGLDEWPFHDRLHQFGKRFAGVVSDFEGRLVDRARELDAGGVICGHIHTPCLRQIDEVMYGNTGDWIRHFSALVEHRDGSLELLRDLGGKSQPSLAVVHSMPGRLHGQARFATAGMAPSSRPIVALAETCAAR